MPTEDISQAITFARQLHGTGHGAQLVILDSDPDDGDRVIVVEADTFRQAACHSGTIIARVGDETVS